MMRNKLKLFGIVATVAVIGLSMASCGDGANGGNSDPTPGVPDVLIGDWYNDDSYPTVVEIAFGTDNQATIVRRDVDEYNVPVSMREWGYVSTNGNRISAVGGWIGGFNFALSNSNNTLTITNASGTFADLNGIYTRN